MCFTKGFAPFVVPVLTGISPLRSGSIPPKGGTTNTECKNSQPRSVSEVRADALLMLFEVAVFAWFSAESTACISHGRKSMETLMQ